VLELVCKVTSVSCWLYVIFTLFASVPESFKNFKLLIYNYFCFCLEDCCIVSWTLFVAGVFNKSRYWDVVAEYAKGGPNDILCKFTGNIRTVNCYYIDWLSTNLHALYITFFWNCFQNRFSLFSLHRILKVRFFSSLLVKLKCSNVYLPFFSFAALYKQSEQKIKTYQLQLYSTQIFLKRNKI